MTAVGKKQASLDDGLIRRSVAGDPGARSELVTACLPRVWRTVYLTCGPGPDVEDLVQTAVINALENLGSYKGLSTFESWLDRLTVNVVRSYFRKRLVRRIVAPTPVIDHVAQEPGGGPHRKLAARRLLDKLSAHLMHIRPKNRVALVLSVVHGYSAGEIAQITGCSQEAAWKRIRRGQQALSARIARDGDLDEGMRELFP